MAQRNTTAAEDRIIGDWSNSLNVQDLLDIIKRLDEIIDARDDTIADMQTDLDRAEEELRELGS